MKEFSYIIDKVNSAEFESEPFKFIYIENFFNDEDFNAIISAEEINVPKFSSTEEMIDSLISRYDYEPQPFPGCVTDINKYLYWINTGNIKKGLKEQDLLEGFGIALRLQKYKTSILQRLVDFFNSTDWHKCIKDKFQKTKDTTVETAIQKYLTGYEISPHPDIRKKCLTYMININPSHQSETIDLHTYFLRLNDDKKWIYDYWKNNPSVDRCWVPWSWATPVFNQRKNNSITIFAPDNDTIHAVKLSYDHCQFQRTQFYGNLWYHKSQLQPGNWKLLEKIENESN